ncbi:hypothetical protein EF847_01820 [Actinobacteria bacterium YIM 96077]|uniref:Uncharacterized protein n=1 Tax=Phytoactinopolyspora halophila TaxID=1981511 RepID=A0A329R073_9ACTN|nr:hypothetical protein [Phytoactinopolyspora halophila]AYY11650.1 hypothetical protein EF847_01820 [Actinobacteria bacterium YIM 96077]RAW17917.1 hypothetical protein DPM12_03460 [Phytoactinopolyspora halophila]
MDNDMTIGHGPVTSLLDERPPEGHLINDLPRQHRSADSSQGSSSQGSSPLHQQYEVVYEDVTGNPLLAFSDGQWWDVAGTSPRPVSVRFALRRDPSWAGAVVQTVCLWMRSNPQHERSFDLATELALAVGELARQLEDD